MNRLITCTDGTWNKPWDKEELESPASEKNNPSEVKVKKKSYDSNVCLIYDAIKDISSDGTRQYKVYDTGVGSSYGWRDKILGGTIGKGLDRKIMDMYAFLVLNYKPDDEIYLFGFSRGAYTARSLAGFIRCCGILKPEFFHLLEKAFELYRDRNVFTSPDSDLMVSFRRNYAVENVTAIHFLGVWDTVGSLGLPLTFFRMYNMEKYKFHDVTLSSTIRNAFHAVSIDDRRKLFQPTLWEQSKKVTDGEVVQRTEQRWFPGVHCNVGGGYEDRGLSNGALQWMVAMANEAGLEFDTHKLAKFPGKTDGILRNSYTPPYWFWFKIWREVFGNKNSDPVFDESVKKRLQTDDSYRPVNLKNFFPDFYK